MEVSVSAIIAVYNPDLSYFEKAVFSVLNQSYRVLELILVNDGGNEALWTTLQFELPAFIILNTAIFVKVNG